MRSVGLFVIVMASLLLLGSSPGPCANDYIEEPEPFVPPTPIRVLPSPQPLSLQPLVSLSDRPSVSVGDSVFQVEVAFTSEARAKGLSGRNRLADGSGMLFVYESGRTSQFWMKGMSFPLDFVWIGDDCTVVDIHTFVPNLPTNTADSDLPRYSPSSPARYNLEIAAGTVVYEGIHVGDRVRFSGIYGEGAVC